MGFFKGGTLFTLSVLLFFSFLALNLFLTLSTSLEYENVQKEISPIVQELANGNNGLFEGFGSGDFNLNQVTDEAQESMKNYCKNNTDYSFVFESNTISIPCSSLEEGKRAIVNEAVRDIVEDAYYRDYDCIFWSCLVKEKIPLFLVSQKAKDYWKEKFYFSLIASLILIALIFFLVEKKLNFPILVGSILILSSLPLLKIKGIISFLIPEKFEALSLFLNIFFSRSYMVFWISFISGRVLLGVGVGLRFSNAEFIKKIIEKSDKKEVGTNGKEAIVKKETTRKKK